LIEIKVKGAFYFVADPSRVFGSSSPTKPVQRGRTTPHRSDRAGYFLEKGEGNAGRGRGEGRGTG